MLPDSFETWGSEATMNLNTMLHQNIVASGYFKSLYAKKTYHEVIDEIYEREPFIRGTNASSAFCLLYKLWTIRLTPKQIKGLLNHTDSPHIRAVGFLYLRYVCKPANLWDWFDRYLDDEEDIQLIPAPREKHTTIGKLCRELLSEPKFLGTQMPRIPIPVAREMEAKLAERYFNTNKSNVDIGRDVTSSSRRHERSRSPRPRQDRRQDDRPYTRKAEQVRDRSRGYDQERGSSDRAKDRSRASG